MQHRAVMLNNLTGVCWVQIDLKTTQLLNSRLFHDLIGVVSAVNTGIEFLAEPGSNEDAANLLKQSADRLTRRVDFFRAAFGIGGGKEGELSLGDAGLLVAGWFADSKSTLVWPSDDALIALADVGPQSIKVLMILSMMAEECLPRGGEVSIQVTRYPEGLGLATSATGQGARAPDGTLDALARNCSSDVLTVRNVATYFCTRLAAAQGARVEMAETKNRIDYASLILG